MSGTTALLSTNWYRIAHLKPRLRGHVRIHRHAYRGEVWYVMEDRLGGKYHRFNPQSYRVISLMNGKRSMDATWERLTGELAEDTPAQEEVIRLLGQMYGADLIQCDVNPDVAELFERRAKQMRRQWTSRYLNPMSLRFQLWDPDRALAKMVVWLRPLAGAGLLLWLAVVLPALLMAPSHWVDLTRNFSEQLLTLDNLIVMGVVFPLIKAAHEMGHGISVKLRGGEVHEMGIMLLMVFPVPYVDASASSAFVRKSDRMLVGAAGMLTELFIAALAFYAWLLLEPGLVRSLAYNAIVLASVTTLLFNANPLLRYDGYYILADWLEIPNLGTRANQYWKYLADRYVFGVKPIEPPAAAPGERRWLIGYAPLAYVYRLTVLFGISMFIAQQYFFVGVVLAVWGLVSSLLIPLSKGVIALVTSPQYAARAQRVRAILAGTLVVLGLMLFVIPFPYHTNAQGVVWLPEQALLRARTSGFVKAVLAEPGAGVRAGDAVVQSLDPELAANLGAQTARVDEVGARYDAAWGSNPSRAGQIEEELRREKAALERLRDDASKLTVRSEARGTLLMDKPADLPGRYIKKGEVLGYVVGEYLPVVRVVVPQPQVDHVRLATRGVEILMPQDLTRAWSAQLTRAVPKAAKELPSPALGKSGGGNIVVDPGDKQGVKAVESLFEFELALPAGDLGRYLGSRVHVRFEHAPEPLGWRLWRDVRRLFLSQFRV